MATNQVSSPSVDPNNINTGKTSAQKNTIAVAEGTSNAKNTIIVESNIRNEKAKEPKRGVNSAIRNKRVEKPNKDAKAGLEV